MADYATVERKTWADSKFLTLSERGKLLWLYLLTGPDANALPGVIVAGRAHLAEMLGWDLEAFDKAFREVSEKAMAKADWGARLVWLPNALKYQRPQSPNVIVHWAKLWLRVTECSLQDYIFEQLKAFTKGLGKAYSEAFDKAFGKLRQSLNLNLNLNQSLPSEDSKHAPTEHVCSEPAEPASEQSASTVAVTDPPNDPVVLEFPVVGKGAKEKPRWSLRESIIREFAGYYPDLDIEGECRRALGWVMGSPERRKTHRGMRKFLTGWLDRSNNGPRPPSGTRPASLPNGTEAPPPVRSVTREHLEEIGFFDPVTDEADHAADR